MTNVEVGTIINLTDDLQNMFFWKPDTRKELLENEKQNFLQRSTYYGYPLRCFSVTLYSRMLGGAGCAFIRFNIRFNIENGLYRCSLIFRPDNDLPATGVDESEHNHDGNAVFGHGCNEAYGFSQHGRRRRRYAIRKSQGLYIYHCRLYAIRGLFDSRSRHQLAGGRLVENDRWDSG